MTARLLSLAFNSGQEIAFARSACKRLLASRSNRLTHPQKTLLTGVLGDLEPIGDGTKKWTIRADLPYLQALHYAVTLQFENLISHHAPDTPGSELAACNALLRRMPDFAIWTDPRRSDGSPELQFVRLGFGDLHGLHVRSLHFEVCMPDRATFAACLAVGIGSSNEFNGTTAAAALAPLWNDISTVTVGRDSDPVVRIRLPQIQQQRNGGDNTLAVPLTGEQLDALAATVLQAARSCGASTLTRHIGPPPQLSQHARRPAEMTLSWRN